MPAKSRKQQRKMCGCLHRPSKMKGKCPPKKVARKYCTKVKR